MKYYEADEDLSGPILKVQEWIQEAEINSVALPHAMNISTLNLEGKPSSRMVLLKRISNEGLVFFTDYEGHKGQQIIASPHVALTFWWAKTNKQIRIEGECSKVSNKESDDYFNSRPLKSRVSAIISNQSSTISSYEDLTNQIDNYLEQNDESSIKRPDHCGLYTVIPNAVEFWQERDNRTHERLKYILSDNQKWSSHLLSP